MKKVFIIIHGMGNQLKGYSNEFQNLIKEKYQVKGYSSTDLVFKEVLWSQLVQQQEEILFENTKHNLSFLGLRKFIIYTLGDVIAYQKTGTGNGFYEKVHELIYETYLESLIEIENGGEIVFVAHSLGAAILSNFIYDNQKSRNDIKFKRIISFGTTIPLWALRHPNMDKPINIVNGQKWINMFDNDDILGYPLSEISKEYKLLNISGLLEDKEVNVGSILTSWNPLSHSAYWTDNDVIEIILNEIN
jgi:hypothetical protein